VWILRAIFWVIGSIIATAGAEAALKEVAGRRSRKHTYTVASVLAIISFFISMVIIPIIDPYTGIWYKFFLSLGIGSVVGGLGALLISIVNKRRSRKTGLVRVYDRHGKRVSG
jgi:peptidoglycan/LPS O-acetylase OafA/YrhL